MTPASSREFGTVSEVTLRKKEFGTMKPDRKEAIDEQIERVAQENREKDRTSSGGTPAKEIPKAKRELSEAEKKEKKAAYMREYWKRYKGPPKQKVEKNKEKAAHLETFKKKLAAAKEAGKAKRKKAVKKAPSARKGISGMRAKAKKGSEWDRMTPAQKQKRYAYARAYRKKMIQQKRSAALGTPPSNGHAKGTFPPYPFRFCPDCGKSLPTVERNGKTFPAAKPFCGDCGYQIPLMKG